MIEPTIFKQREWTNLLIQIKKQQVILTASICLIALIIVLKNLLLVPSTILIKDTMIYSVIYFGFLFFAFKTDNTEEISENIRPLVWDVLVILITMAIIAVYAL